MKNTKLYIAVNGDYRELDITDIDILLQFEEVNIRSFESLKAEHSKTIVLSGTQTNNEILGYLYDITTSSSFDVLKAAPCYIESENNILFDGSFKLINVTLNPNGVKEYECVLTAKTLDFFDNLKTLRLKDIDLSDFEHTLTKSNVENSWATSIRYQNTTVPFELGFGYVYPLEFRGVNDIGYLWSPKDMSPAIYLKTLIDKGLAQLGYNYRSNFFNSDDFKRLIMPNVYQRVPLTQNQIDNKQFIAKRSSDSVGTIQTQTPTFQFTNFYIIYYETFMPNTVVNSYSSTFFALDLFNQDVQDAGNHFNQGTGQIVYINQFVSGTIKVQLDYDFIISVFENPSLPFNYRLSSYTLTQNVGNSFPLANGSKWKIDVQLYNNNALIETQSKSISVPSTPITTTNAGAFVDTLLLSESGEFNFQVNGAGTYFVQVIFSSDDYQAVMYSGNANITAEARAKLNIKDTSRLSFILDDTYCQENDTISIQQCFNNSTTLFDLFKDLGKMFNLRYEFENDDKTIVIEPATTYYDNGVIKDWSKKIDDNQPILIETISDLDFDSLKFHYVEDGDYHNKYTLDTYDAYYGEQVVSIENDWSNEERVIKTDTIASTPNVNYIGDISLPYYVTYEGGNYKPMSEIKPRILIYGGLVQSSSNWCWISKLIHYTSQNIIANFRNTYPFAGHINTPYNQTWDINFGTRPAYYWAYNTITDNNLYNRFYKQFIDSEINPDTKILTAYFNLTDEDIYKFRYNDKIFIDNTYYRVNKIIDYNPIKSELTKVELVKIVDVDVFIPQARIIKPNDWINVDTISKGDTGGGGGAIPVEDISKPTIGGSDNSFARIDNGYQNIISKNSFNVLINGNNNLVQANSLNVTITGDNNQVLNGATNVVVIGSGIKITESNTSYIEGIGFIQNGVLVPQEFNVLDGGQDEVQNQFSVTTLNIVDGMSDSVQQVNYDYNINIIE